MHIATLRYNFGLEYKPATMELRESKRRNREELKPYKKTLNGHFVNKGNDFPFYGFLEPWVDVIDMHLKQGFVISLIMYSLNMMIHSFQNTSWYFPKTGLLL